LENQALSESVWAAINAFPEGFAFTSKDLADIANPAVIRQTLGRLAKSGKVRRLLRGVYDVPRKSLILNSPAPPSINSIAEAFARAHGWTIVPTGAAALNLLGLSTQVPATWTFLSDGPSKTIMWEAGRIEFKHRTNKEITLLSPTTALVVQALKELGQEGVNEEIIAVVSKKMSAKEKEIALREAKIVTSWVYETIKSIFRYGVNPDA